MDEEAIEKFNCMICYNFILSPACCSKCKKIYCKECLEQLKQTLATTCPLRCTNWSVQNLSDTEHVEYNTTLITCECCKHKIILKNYQEHKIAFDSAYVCFNFRRCKRLGKYQSRTFDRPSFCSPDCYQFFWTTRVHFREFYDDLYQKFKQNPELFADCWRQNIADNELFQKESRVLLDQENCAPEYSFPASNRCVLSSSSRFYKTVYNLEPLVRSRFYIFRIELEHHQNFVKIGVAKENRKLDNGAFCDDEFGIAFVTNGQTRRNNVDGSITSFKSQDLDVKGFFIQVDMINYEFIISVMPVGLHDDEESYRAVLKIPEEWDECYLAFAAKHNESIYIS